MLLGLTDRAVTELVGGPLTNRHLARLLDVSLRGERNAEGE